MTATITTLKNRIETKKLTTIRFAWYTSTNQRKPKGNHKSTLSPMPAWEIAISPVHTEAFRNFSDSAVGIASLSSWLVANWFSISDSFDGAIYTPVEVLWGCGTRSIASDEGEQLDLFNFFSSAAQIQWYISIQNCVDWRLHGGFIQKV